VVVVVIQLFFPNVREYEDANFVTSGSTKIQFKYTKNDPRVTTLEVSLLDQSGAPISSSQVDVSNVQVGGSITTSVTLPNNLSPVDIVLYTTTPVTVPAGGTSTYTAPTDSYSIVLAESYGVIVQINGNQYPFSNNVVVYPGTTITLFNPDVNDVSVPVTNIPSISLIPITLTVSFIERDANGSALSVQNVEIDDIPPIALARVA
jgi:hypothetical protein